jgi:hypothetical protein
MHPVLHKGNLCKNINVRIILGINKHSMVQGKCKQLAFASQSSMSPCFNSSLYLKVQNLWCSKRKLCRGVHTNRTKDKGYLPYDPLVHKGTSVCLKHSPIKQQMPTNGLKGTNVITSHLPRVTPELNQLENRSPSSTWLVTTIYDKYVQNMCVL